MQTNLADMFACINLFFGRLIWYAGIETHFGPVRSTKWAADLSSFKMNTWSPKPWMLMWVISHNTICFHIVLINNYGHSHVHVTLKLAATFAFLFSLMQRLRWRNVKWMGESDILLKIKVLVTVHQKFY